VRSKNTQKPASFLLADRDGPVKKNHTKTKSPSFRDERDGLEKPCRLGWCSAKIVNLNAL
jgi:hypothetical protein